MRKKILALSFVFQFSFWPACAPAQVPKASYPVRAPFEQYLIADESAEIALARSAAPASISDAAEVMVLRRDGYTTAAKGSNEFVCIVERSWATTSDDPQFWNAKVRAPHCFNPPAAKTVLPVYLMKSKMVLSGKSRVEIAAAITSVVENKELPALVPGTMVYMMSKQQYLNDDDVSWHPHLMFFAAGDARKSWGANLPGSPVMAAYDAEQQVTTFFVLASKWSDGTPVTSMAH
ncbi:MAG TPA: hypothetical protein VGD64_06720 [Acidisarcina sp.]